MPFNSPEFYSKLLSYGVTGLGAILAYLAFVLLKNEQAKPAPRLKMLRSIQFYSLFAVALCVAGLISEYFKKEGVVSGSSTEELTTLRAQVTSLKDELTSTLNEKIDREKSLASLRAVIPKYGEEIESAKLKQYTLEAHLSEARSKILSSQRELMRVLDSKVGELDQLDLVIVSDPEARGRLAAVRSSLRGLDVLMSKSLADLTLPEAGIRGVKTP